MISALFPKATDLSLVEHLSLSLGTSISVVSLLGFILNYTPSVIKLYPIIISTVSFILFTAAIGYYRQQLMPAEQRFGFTINSGLIKQVDIVRIYGVLFILITISIVAAFGYLIYTMAKPKVGEIFTEFYILNSKHIAGNYPIIVSSCTPVNVALRIVNHEQ